MKQFSLNVVLCAVLIPQALAADSKSAATKPAASKLAPIVTIALDATEAPRKILHAKLTIPAKPGS